MDNGEQRVRQATALAVHSVDEVAFTVPDLAEARHFYEHFGLDVREEDGGLALYTHGHAHRWVRLLRGECKQLQWVAFGVYPGDLERFRYQLEAAGVVFIAPVPGARRPLDPSEELWFEGADGLPTCLRVAPKSSPSAPAPQHVEPACSNAGRAPARSAVRQVRPLYLSHMLFFSPDVPSATAFFFPGKARAAAVRFLR